MAEFVISTDLEAIEQTQILANFDEVLAAVRELAAPYQGMIVTGETMRNAAADRAKLRKLRERLDAQRKTVKAACMAPAEVFAKCLSPALQEIDRAVENIDTQIKTLEEEARAEKYRNLESLFESLLTAETEPYVSFEKLKSRHPKWANKGCTVGEAENDIRLDLTNIQRGISALRGYPQQYQAVLLEAFSARYDLGDVVEKYARLKEIETQEAKREEIRKAQEAARAALEARRLQEVEQHAGEAERSPGAEDEPVEPILEAARSYDFRVWATREQIGRLREFLNQNRIRYGKVPKEE